MLFPFCDCSLKNQIQNHINDLEISTQRKRILENRYLCELVTYETKSKVAEFFYLFLSIFVTIATIVLPALLSIQEVSYSDDPEEDKNFKTKIYWSTWVISLLVTISNGLVQFLNLHTQFITFSQTREKLLSIGWAYFQLAKPFRGGTHESMFLDFMEAIDMIIKQQINQEMQFISENAEDKDKNRKPSIPKVEDTFTVETEKPRHSILEMENISDKKSSNLQLQIKPKTQSNINKISKI